MKLFSILCVLLIVGCAKNESAGGNGAATKAHDLDVPQNSCRVQKPDGSVARVHLLRFEDDGLSIVLGNQAVYMEGQFPKQTTIGNAQGKISRTELLKNAQAVSWSLSSRKDDQGKWTKLSLAKEILYGVDGQIYVLEAHTFNYGDDISVEDADGHVNISCSVPIKSNDY